MNTASLVASLVAFASSLFLMGMLAWGEKGQWLWAPVCVIALCMAVCLVDAFFGPDETDEEGEL